MLKWVKKFGSGFAFWTASNFGKLLWLYIWVTLFIVGNLFVFYKVAMRPTQGQTQKQSIRAIIFGSNNHIEPKSEQKQTQNKWIPDLEVSKSTQGKNTDFTLKWCFK